MPLNVSSEKDSHSLGFHSGRFWFEPIFGSKTDKFLLKVTSFAKYPPPLLKTPIISIKDPFLNNPIGSFPLKLIGAPEVKSAWDFKLSSSAWLLIITNTSLMFIVPDKGNSLIQHQLH